MKLSVLLLLAASFTAMAETEDHVNKHLIVQPGGQLVVEVDFGSVAVTTNSGGEVVVDATRKVRMSSKEAEEKYLREAPVEITQEGNKVLVRCHAKGIGEHVSGFAFWRKGSEMGAEYNVSVPAQFNPQITTAGGAIKVQDISGTVNARTSGGSLTFERVQGPVDGNTSGGSIRSEDCQGTLKLNTSGGSIRITGGGGSVNGQTSGGSITVKEFKGPADVHTSGGSMTLENIGGAVNGSTSGGSIHAVLIEPLPGAVQLETTGGSVTVASPEKTAFNLDAQTSGGRVSCDLPITAVEQTEKSQLRGAINGGGQTVRLRTSGGSIHVNKL